MRITQPTPAATRAMDDMQSVGVKMVTLPCCIPLTRCVGETVPLRHAKGDELPGSGPASRALDACADLIDPGCPEFTLRR